MMKKLLLITFLICLIPGFVFAETWADYEHTKGGDADALDSKANPQTGDVRFVFGTIDGFQSFSVYKFDSSVSTAESGQTFIAPDDSTAGRWVQQQPFFVFGTTGDLSDITDQEGVVKFTTE